MNVITAPVQTRNPSNSAKLIPAAQSAEVRHLHRDRDRDFGVGYGNSSGYASTRRYTSNNWVQPLFRCA